MVIRPIRWVALVLPVMVASYVASVGPVLGSQYARGYLHAGQLEEFYFPLILVANESPSFGNWVNRYIATCTDRFRKKSEAVR